MWWEQGVAAGQIFGFEFYDLSIEELKKLQTKYGYSPVEKMNLMVIYRFYLSQKEKPEGEKDLIEFLDELANAYDIFKNPIPSL